MITSILNFISDSVEREASDFLFVVGGIVAVITLYALLRANFPSGAKVMAWPFRAVWRIAVTVFTLPRWAWRQLWRQSDGVSRGPFIRITKRVVAWQTGIVRGVVGPMFQATQEASRQQHDEQNEKIDAQIQAMEEGFAAVHERLDRGADVMAKHTEAIERFQAHIDGEAHGHALRPRPKGE
jgi:hypothetical protein